MEISEIVKKIKRARNVFVCGNGGSAATAEHFTNDLFSKGIKTHCLNSNVSIITMLANDYGYKYIFSKQLEVYAENKDLLIVFSTSGKSPNILEAVNTNICPVIQIFGSKNEPIKETEDGHLKLCHKIIKKL